MLPNEYLVTNMALVKPRTDRPKCLITRKHRSLTGHTRTLRRIAFRGFQIGLKSSVFQQTFTRKQELTVLALQGSSPGAASPGRIGAAAPPRAFRPRRPSRAFPRRRGRDSRARGPRWDRDGRRRGFPRRLPSFRFGIGSPILTSGGAILQQYCRVKEQYCSNIAE